MKCPFLTIKKDVVNKEGKKISEEIELQECIKNECMVYDGATKLCSLLSSNMKTGVLIDDIKNGIKDIKDEMFQRAEALSTAVSTTTQTLQEALLGRFDILKKQNEVMVLGFDRLMETINKKFEGVKTSFSKFNDNTLSLQDAIIEALKGYSDTINSTMHTIREAIENQGSGIHSIILSLQQAVNEIKNVNVKFSGDIKDFSETLLTKLAEYNEGNEKAHENTSSKLGVLTENVQKLTTTNQLGMETISGAIEKIIAAHREVVTALGQLDTLMTGVDSMNDVVKNEIAGLKASSLNVVNSFGAKFDELGTIFTEVTKTQEQSFQVMMSNFVKIGEGIKDEITDLKSNNSAILEDIRNEVGNYVDGVKSEIISLKNDQVASLSNVQGGVAKLEDLFKQSSENLTAMSAMMRDLNNNYLESLGKIAGLAEGMRKGVEKVGEGMHDSVNDLIGEMGKEIGALEKQYEKTFSDIANLADKFGGLNTRLNDMTKEVQKEFKESFDRQTELANYTKTIVEHIKTYFDKEDVRYQEEQRLRKRKEGLDHFDRATLYYYRGNYELAVNEINKALDIEQTVEYLNLKGLLLADLGQFDESKEIYKKALKVEPNLAEIHNNMGLLYLKMKKLDDAVVSFQEAVKKNVNYAFAYVNLGKALIDMEKFDEAIKAYERALEIDPSNQDARESVRLYKEGKIGG